MTTWADLFDRAASIGVDVDAIREALDRQRTDDAESDADGVDDG